MGQFCSNTCTTLLLVILCASSLIQGSEGTCSKPADVANANLRSKYRDIETFNESSEVEYDCNIGYSITGRSRNRKCLKSRNWSPVEFDCELIRCTYLPHPENGRRTDANNGAGETTRFSCNPGYSLKGPSQLVCRTDGEWSPRYTPKCEPILCPELSSLRNGDIFQDTSDGVRNNYGSIAQYTCNYGFTINGTRSRQINRRCEADGTWDGHNYFCDTEKCEPIEFYGGNLQYFGSIHRSEGTYAYYSCHEGYTMSPPGIDYSECKRTSLRWEPEPPKCYGNCRFEEYQPVDSTLVRRQRARTDRDAIIHGEKIIHSCKNQRSNELCVRPNDHDLCTYYEENFETTCVNGTFDKINRDTLITCPEKRCSITYQTNTCVWSNGENCIKENYKIQSQSSVNVKCNDGNRYELFENTGIHKRYPNVDSSTMKCDRGHLLTDLSCLPKRCDMSDIPTNMFTSRTPDKRHIMHNEQIVYSCINDQYELYVNSTNSFPRAFTSTCRFGDFDVPKQNFPMCIERRCDITYQTSVFAHACFWTDDDHGGQCKPENFKIASGSSVNIGCKDGYELYDPIQAKYIDLERSEMTCIKGQYSKNLSCKRKRCALSDLPMNNFTIRTPVGTHIEHGQSISYTCNNSDDYELYVDNSHKYLTSFSATCSLGNITTSPLEFPLCVEKHCEFRPKDGVCYQRGEQCHSSRFDLKSQDSIKIKCTDRYKLISESGDEEVETATIKCIKGKPEEDIYCVPESRWENFKEHFAKVGGKLVAKAKYFCRFSIVQLFACSDSCLPDKIENGVVTNTDASVVLQEVKDGLKVNTRCNKGYDRVGRSDNICKNGEWKYSFPQCNPKPCSLTLNGNEILLYNDSLITRKMRNEEVFQNGDRLQISCAEGYTLRPNIGVYEKDDNEWMTCDLGSWRNHHTCTPKKCRVPEVDHTSVKAPADQFVHHLNNVKFTCENGYHFNQTFSKEKGRTTVSEFVATCSLGNWLQAIPPQCNPDGCHFSVHEGSHYFISNEKLSEASLIAHNTDVTTNCSDGYDLRKNGLLVNYTHSTVTCHLGSWQNIHLCRKRIAGQDHSIKTATDVTLQTSPTSTEQLPDENNETTSTESDAETIADVTMPTTLQPLECEIPVYSIYEFSFDGERKEGSMVPHKTVLNVKCRIVNYDYNFDDDQQTVQCVNGILGTANISCQNETPVEEKTFSCKLENGKVQQRSNWKYEDYYLEVSCNEGYKLNLILPDKPYCKCNKTGDLMCDYGGQTPKCLPEDCKIPKEFDQRLTLYERSEGHIVGLSKGQTVEHWKTVYFKCTHSITERFEPYDTPFTCMNGKWLEAATHEEWTKTNSSYFPQCIKVNCDIPETYDSLLNIYVNRKGSTTSLSGGMSVDHGESVFFYCSNTETDYFELDDTLLECMKGKWLKVSTHEEWLNSNSSKFPECRKANCVPMCQNGGKCVGNNKCMCQEKSTGSICETVECDPECLENGGKCTGPGICGLCPDGKNGHNCQLSEHLIKYVIQIKTGTDLFAGTGASVYVYLHGPKSATHKLYIDGSYVGNGLVERTLWAEDVTPIRYVRVGRESVTIRDDLQVDFVSIIVDFDNGMTNTDNQFYHFDAEPDLWINDSVDQKIRLSEIKYLIQIKTGSHTYAGPDAKLYVILHGEKYSSQKLYVGKTYYGEGKYEDSIMAVDITPIGSITVARESIQDQEDLQVDFVSIFVDFDNGTTADDQFYNFDAKPDIRIHSADQSITLSGCVYTFKQHIDKYPRFAQYMDRVLYLGKGDKISERTCKQLCVQHANCAGVCYYKRNNECLGFSETDRHYFKYSTTSNYFQKYCLK